MYCAYLVWMPSQTFVTASCHACVLEGDVYEQLSCTMGAGAQRAPGVGCGQATQCSAFMTDYELVARDSLPYAHGLTRPCSSSRKLP